MQGNGTPRQRKSPSPLSKQQGELPAGKGAASSRLQTLLILALLFIPLLFRDQQRISLAPLFSSAPLSSVTFDLNLVLSLSFLITFILTPLRTLVVQHAGTASVLLGWSLVTSEAVVRLGGVWFQSFGARGGVWVSRLAVEGLTVWLRWATVLGTLSGVTREGKSTVKVASFFAVAIPVLALDFQPSVLSTVWECRILQVQGCLIIGATIGLNVLKIPLSSAKSSNGFGIRNTPHFIILATLILAYATSLTSPHCPLSPLRPSFLPSLVEHSDTKILASEKGFSGTVVTGEYTMKGSMFRYLRVDHSLLGGLWIGTSRKRVIQSMLDRKVSMWATVDEEEVIGTAESIYSTFILQEIVRLAAPMQRFRRERGLIIGLGAGLSARALQIHGVNLTVCEIDPVVYKYARKYFGVPETPGGTAIEDARVFLDRKSDERYDYVIHDVFTGGTVPSSLFTLECWAAISRSLSPIGLVAINFAGAISAPSAHMVISTILKSFVHCRAFEDGPPSGDYRNLVLICANRQVNFRKPVPEDYLPYPSAEIRRRVLDTFREYEIDLRGTNRSEVLSDATAWKLDAAQIEGAFTHWNIMGQVLTPEAWAMY